MGNDTKEVTRILIVDDVETNRFTLRDIIADMGCQPILTENGAQALKIVERFPLQLIISDVAMPVMDGYEFCQRVKENPETREIPIIFISAFDDPSDIVKGFELKGEDYITKPFIPEVVQARVKVHLKLSETNKKMQEMNRKLQASVTEQMKQMEVEKQNVLYALLRTAREHPSYDAVRMDRLAGNCKTLAEALQLSREFGGTVSDAYINTIELAAPLCGLGNIAVATELFEKEELTLEEQQEREKHTIIGAEILQDIKCSSSYNDFLDMSIHIARSHHENWDGSGFPDKLKGENIPLSAQIVHIAKDYGDLTGRKGLSIEDTLLEMEKGSGILYNPEILDILRKISRQLQ